MESIAFFGRGILIGLIFGVPAGAVGAMTVQRTCSSGFKAGLLTGLGSSAADCLYAAIGAFGLTLISGVLLRHQTAIRLIGGALVLGIGLSLLLRGRRHKAAAIAFRGRAGIFFASFAVGITNPAAILTFLFAFSYFGVAGAVGPAQGCALVCGVFIGTYLWWSFLSFATCAVKKKTGSNGFPYMNRICGGILVAFGAVIYVRLFTQA